MRRECPSLWSPVSTASSRTSCSLGVDSTPLAHCQRSVPATYRLIGCFLGGATALICIALPLTELLPWLGALGAGVWISCYIQTSERGVGNIGTQAAIVFIITLVQGWAPPTSILPGIDRFAGMAAGVTILLVVTMLIWPDPEPEAPSSAQ
jgi:uncharacterized membrane protein YccC